VFLPRLPLLRVIVVHELNKSAKSRRLDTARTVVSKSIQNGLCCEDKLYLIFRKVGWTRRTAETAAVH
jgi:hypothetical protein